MVKLDMSYNSIKAEGGKALAEALKDNQIMQELNVASNDLRYNSSYNSDMSGIIAIASTISTMGAMTSLNVSSNNLRAEGAKHIAAALPECK